MAKEHRKRASRGGRAAAKDVRIVLSTAPVRAAAALATHLVESGLAACVTVVKGGESVYRWRGKVERARESLLLVKTTRRDLEALLAALAKRHPYEVPEGLVLEPTDGLRAYLKWIALSGR